MSDYLIEVETPTHSGWHNSGSGMPGDAFTITGKQFALSMSLDFAKRRVEMYRANRCKARIVSRDGVAIVDWSQPTATAQQPIDIYNSHELVTYQAHGLEIVCIHNRAINKYFHRYRWPIADGPEQSISGLSPEEIVLKLLSVPDLAGYVDTLRVDDSFPVAIAPAAPPPPAIQIELPAGYEGYEVTGVRPGSIR